MKDRRPTYEIERVLHRRCLRKWFGGISRLTESIGGQFLRGNRHQLVRLRPTLPDTGADGL